MNELGSNVDKKQDDSSIVCKEYERVEWQDWRSCLYTDDIAVFRFYCAEDTIHQPDWSALLHTDEIERGGRYHRRDDRLRSLYTRSLLRILVGRYTNQDPLAIHLTKGLRNKPELPNNLGWHVNAAHSGNWILLAIGRDRVGIDVEEIKPDFAFTDVIPISFIAQEREYIEADGKSTVRFYELWTRKEAFVKAIGSGIDETFSQVPALTGFHKLETTKLEVAGEWVIDSFNVTEKYSAAIAYNCSPKNIQFYTIAHGIFTPPDKR
ncbi:4'-phosphopantetheinyl transferase superfamily protein [Persicitalea sp.]|uniref:4'-phosphopantetheinyl transferase family protein n=1 Tax=Persicitalea sp. TaxID=3100273 RepID=UPI003594396A